MVPNYFPRWSHLLLLPMTSIRPPLPVSWQHPVALLWFSHGTWRGLWFVMGSNGLFTDCLRQRNGWAGWVHGMETGGNFQKIGGVETVFTQKDELETLVSQRVSSRYKPHSGLIWVDALGLPWGPSWLPESDLMLSKLSPYAHKLQGWACFESLALPILEHSMFSNCCTVSLRGWSLEIHSFGQPISV